jgi:hypothetical protein
LLARVKFSVFWNFPHPNFNRSSLFWGGLCISHETKHFVLPHSSHARKIFPYKIVAQELCKPHHHIEEARVSFASRPLFHKLINICVENFTVPKYFFCASACLLLSRFFFSAHSARPA